jgi:hypothetical protein
MNIALNTFSQSQEHCIVSVKNVGGRYLVRGKRILPSGDVKVQGEDFWFDNLKDATTKCRDLAKIKMKKRGWKPVDLVELPKNVVQHLEVPPDMVVTPEEMVLILREIESERYVVFSNVFGLEDRFDLEVEYIGYECDDGKNKFLKVFDKFGKLSSCFSDRFSSIVPTERALEVINKKKKGTEEGETCWRNGCKGKIEIAHDGISCTCHTGHPPCSYCVSSRPVCPVCGWGEENA